MAKLKKLGILTSGGDSQGMNACIKTVVTMAARNGFEVVAFLGGFQGLLDNKSKSLTMKDVEISFNLGGSVIGSGRSKDFTDAEKRKKSKEVCNNHKLDALIVLGGDGTVRGARDLRDLGVNVIAIPCTIDNDVYCTERSIGFDTAVNNAVEAIDNIKQTMIANERVLVVEVMGRHCGDIALHSGLCGESDIIAIPEKAQTMEKIVREVGKQIKAGNLSPTVVVAENQLDISELDRLIEESTGRESKDVVIGYVQRGGSPTVQDRLLAIQMGVASVNCILENKFGLAMVLKNGEIERMDLDRAVSIKRKFSEHLWQTFLSLKKFKTIKKQ